MARLGITLLLACFALQAVGGWSMVIDLSGVERCCASEERNGDCTPGCDECACWGGKRVVFSRGFESHPLAVRSRLGILASRPPVAPDPGEIFHVPKLLLA